MQKKIIFCLCLVFACVFFIRADDGKLGLGPNVRISIVADSIPLNQLVWILPQGFDGNESVVRFLVGRGFLFQQVLQQTPQQDPHEGQPSHCVNYPKEKNKAHYCECKKTADSCDQEDTKCKVYCRKNHCHCFHPTCDS